MPSKIDFASLHARTTTLDEDRARSVELKVLRRHARHSARIRATLIAGGTLLALAPIVLFAQWLAHRGHESSVVAAASAASAGPAPSFGDLVMTDGSRVTFLTAGTELAQSTTQDRQSTLVRGEARFEVVHDARAPFRVKAGSVVVEDVGTVFTIRLEAEGATFVSVESGSVSVRGPHGEQVLETGASRLFEAANPSETPSSQPASPPASASTPSPPSHPARQPSSSWQSLAQTGEYERAYTVMQDHGSVVRDDPEELLLAADAARLSGHPNQAVPHLRRLVEKAPSDSRAVLASFTLGRVLSDLGRSREAAEAFASAHARGGPLAEDALAREAEAWQRAGDRAAARRAAERYLATYPGGVRAAVVRRIADTP